AAAGVGRSGLIDFDVIDVTNLQRQVLYATSQVGRPKLDAAVGRLRDLNSEIAIEAHQVALTSQNALDILARYDVVVDGTDNFPTRYLVNDACVMLGKPNVYGSIYRFEGQASVFATKDGPCYRCLYAEPPPPGLVPSCAEGGVLGVLPGVIGTIQAIEAIKLLAGIGETLAGRLLLFDALRMSFRQLVVRKSADCAVCGEAPTIKALIDYESFCNPAAAHPRASADELTPDELASMLERGEGIVLVDIREPYEWSAGHLAGARHIPMGTLQDALPSLPRDAEIVLYCRSGGRSGRALSILREAGFDRATHLGGGLLAWKRERDPSMRVV
ncbi:MAG TPA: ThiF family adenylyltransferase, partial [Thermoanaerobaculia bacterium]|nr:ThiF family adenylyltransferase [Thermoanaerobaculia bacterium]